ncbi:MAG TPA: hypothetical protein VGL81_09095 [Polyangiaceae bacterium]|jgi:hypothetical protein
MARHLLAALAALGLAVVALVHVAGAQSGYGGAPGVGGTIQSGSQAVIVPNASPVPLWTEPAESAATLYDTSAVVACETPSAAGDAGAGNLWRADLEFNTQRIGDAGPTVPAAMTVSNLRTSGVGAVASGASVAIVGTSAVLSWGGAASAPFTCSAFVRHTEAP